MHASQPIPIASSSKVPQDNTLSTPRNPQYLSSSPFNFRPGSYGHRFYPGCSPIQPLGPLAMPDFKYSLSSSIESEHDNLIKALNGDVMTMQDDMCRNYTCCGLALLDLHALLEHFEEAHVVVLESSALAPAFQADSSGGGFDMLDDMEFDSAPSSAPLYPNAHFPAAPSAFDMTSVLVRRTTVAHGHNPFSPYPPSQHAATRSQSVHQDPTASALRRYQGYSDHSALPGTGPFPSNAECVQPALLFSASATPSPLNTPAASRGASPDLMASSNSEPSTPSTPTTPSPTSQVGAAASLSFQKPFRCPKPGCNKSYKQANGLKYHVTHGQCNFAPADPSVEGLTDQEAEKKMKPYLCQVGCNKRFKNMSGLRYHYQHTAEHGKIGLALLQAGQLPVVG